MDFRTTSVRELAAKVRRGEIGARELAKAALERISQLDGRVNAFVAVDQERALEQAGGVDQLVASGVDPGPLAGIPLAVKDLEDTAGYPTTSGSPLHAGAPAALADSILVERLRAAGCVVVGKTNTPEFGWSSFTANALYGTTKNPWDLTRSPGGSSGGSAAALAAGMVPLATGSDGGGSIRIPAACCGLSGIKTSLGRIPSGGRAAPQWPDLSSPGPMARTMADVASALSVVVGPHPSDLRALPPPELPWRAALEDPHVPVRIAWSPTLGYAPLDQEVRDLCEKAVGVLESLGAEVETVETVFPEDPVGAWLTLVGPGLLRATGDPGEDPAWDKVHPILRSMVEGARSLSARAYIDAMAHCHDMNLALTDLFHRVRLLVTPTTAGPPPPLELESAGLVNGMVDANWVRFTYPFNMTRSPAASVWAGLTRDGLPVGIQLVGPAHGDLVVLRAALALESALGFEQLAPIG